MRQLLAVFWVTSHQAPQFPPERLHLHCLVPAGCAQQAESGDDDFVNGVASLLSIWQKIGNSLFSALFYLPCKQIVAHMSLPASPFT